MASTFGDSTAPAQPLLAESSSSESVGVETVMNDMRDGIVTIPDYQRDGDQWDEVSRSLFVESIINNLTVPALFFEAQVGKDGVERSEVVDGQQRLTTLRAFYEGQFSLVPSNDAPYLSPNSIHYAGKKFDELPVAYKQAFKKYRLTVIRLRQLGDMRLEVFRRINQGGTPLSGQDIRLAYFGDGSPSMGFIRLVGIYDQSSAASGRFIQSAKGKYGLKLPWSDDLAFGTWNDWWAEKEISRGQTASEMFLWALTAAQAEKLGSLLSNPGALKTLKCRYNETISEALDAHCAQIQYQDRNPEQVPLLMQMEEMREKFFPFFQKWVDFLLRRAGSSIPVTRHRIVGTVIGAAYPKQIYPEGLKEPNGTEVAGFIRSPRDVAKSFKVDWPESKGRWGGLRGYRAQFAAAAEILSHLRS
ncbi:MAG TPA: DUF262 domain-containing protein [Bryobacteraceae bacterium]|nr:DUF262 domain-containing protein [Bryobacteraceae bacterium]